MSISYRLAEKCDMKGKVVLGEESRCITFWACKNWSVNFPKTDTYLLTFTRNSPSSRCRQWWLVLRQCIWPLSSGRDCSCSRIHGVIIFVTLLIFPMKHQIISTNFNGTIKAAAHSRPRDYSLQVDTERTSAAVLGNFQITSNIYTTSNHYLQGASEVPIRLFRYCSKRPSQHNSFIFLQIIWVSSGAN